MMLCFRFNYTKVFKSSSTPTTCNMGWDVTKYIYSSTVLKSNFEKLDFTLVFPFS